MCKSKDTLTCHSEVGSRYEAQAGLGLTIIQFLFPMCRDDSMRLEVCTRTAALHGRGLSLWSPRERSCHLSSLPHHAVWPPDPVNAAAAMEHSAHIAPMDR